MSRVAVDNTLAKPDVLQTVGEEQEAIPIENGDSVGPISLVNPH